MSKRFEEINDKGSEVQLSLFSSIPETVTPKKSPWPEYRRGDRYLDSIITNPDQYIGLDLEFNPKTKVCTILGLSNKDFCASSVWNIDRVNELIWLCEEGHKLVGFSVNGAEKSLFEHNLGKKLPIDYFEDTMLLFYLHNQHLTKSSGGKADYEKGSLGFINLWTCASLCTSLPMWKLCRETACDGEEPCPRHNVWGYNAIDSYAGLVSFLGLKDKTSPKLWSLYRDLMTLSEIAQKMQDNGVNIDKDLVKKLDKVTDEEKDKLFPYELVNNKKVYPLFNPNSPKEAIEFFKKKKIKLDSFNKPDIVNYIQKICKKKNVAYDDFLVDRDNTEDEKLLVKAALFKGAGKGFKAWFSERYYGEDGLLHPRFITTGTSTGRWSSSKPNFQNIPSYEEGDDNVFHQARFCIIPKRKDYRLLKFDKSNLEYRYCMFLAGFDSRKIPDDVFKWLVSESGGSYSEAAKFLGRDERFVAKSLVYGSLFGEGMVLLDEQDLSQKKKIKELEFGALKQYEDWTHFGKYVCFTGVNLAQRLFGVVTDETRKRALYIQEDIYFKQFPMLRNWHRSVLKELEETNQTKSPYGRYRKYFGETLDNIREALSFYGQGGGADHVQSGILRFYQEYGDEGVPLLQIHDELDFEKPRSWSKEESIKFLSISEEEDYRLPGFWCPVKMYWGENLAQMERIK